MESSIANLKGKYKKFCEIRKGKLASVSMKYSGDTTYNADFLSEATNVFEAWYATFEDKNLLLYHLSRLETRYIKHQAYLLGIVTGLISGLVVYLLTEVSDLLKGAPFIPSFIITIFVSALSIGFIFLNLLGATPYSGSRDYLREHEIKVLRCQLCKD